MNAAVRIIIIVVALGALAYFGNVKMAEGKLRNEYNSIVDELVNNEKYEEAITRLETLQSAGGSTELQDQTRKMMALCYFRMGQDPALTGEKMTEFIRKAFSIDPDLQAEHGDDFPAITSQTDAP